MIEELVSSNFPLYELYNNKFSGFLEKYTGCKIYSITHYRNKVFENIYLMELNTIKEIFVKADELYIVFDETIDGYRRSILNVLIGVCKVEERTKPYLIGCVSLSNKNAVIINAEILQMTNSVLGNNQKGVKNCISFI